MTKLLLRDECMPDCPIRNVLARMSDKWSMLVLLTLHEASKPLRFNALQRAIPDISQKVLTTTLRNLQSDGMILRQAYAEVPPRVEYSLTNRGESFIPHITSLVEWAEENMVAIMKERMEKSCVNGEKQQ